MNYMEVMFDYGYWSVELRWKGGGSWAVHEWLIVALWRVWKYRYFRAL